MKQLILLCILTTAPAAWAGFVEVGASGTYKRTNIDTNAYDQSSSLSGSLAYYFDEMSALEVSYTDGTSKRVLTSSTPNRTTTLQYQMMGLDFVLTLGEREAILRPYFKLGVNYILKKKLIDEIEGYPTVVREDSGILVPSTGLGARILLTRNLSFKFGMDIWTSRSLYETPVQYDFAVRAGISWMF